jgi:hypothetical protein
LVRCPGCGATSLLDARRRCPFCGHVDTARNARVSPQEVAAWFDAHRRGRPLGEIARAIWRAKGYASAASARTSLQGHFAREEVRRGLRPAPPRRRRGARRRLSDEQVAAAYRRYREEGISAHVLASELYKEAGYKSAAGCEAALGRAFHEAGYEVRDRIEATRLASTRHGLAPKHGPRPGYGAYKRRVLRGKADRPACKGTKATGPGRGEPCGDRAAAGSDFCFSHDPARQAERRAHLDAIHAANRRRVAAAALPMGPFAAFVAGLVAAEGGQQGAASRLGLSVSSISVYARGLGSDKRPKSTIQVRTVERALACDGRELAEVYPETTTGNVRAAGGG